MFTGYVSFVDVFALYLLGAAPTGLGLFVARYAGLRPGLTPPRPPAREHRRNKIQQNFSKTVRGLLLRASQPKIRLLRPRFWFALTGAHQKLTLPPAFWMLDTLPGTMVILVSAGTKTLIPQWDHGAGHTGWASSFGLEGLASSLTGLRIVSYDTQR